MAFKTYKPNKGNKSKKVLRAQSRRIMRELGYIHKNGKWVKNNANSKS